MEINDTSPEARRVLIDIYRQMSVTEKASRLFDACRTGKDLAMAGIRKDNPNASDEKIWRIWAKRKLGNLFSLAYGNNSDE